MFEPEILRIGVSGIRKNKPDGKPGTWWTRGGFMTRGGFILTYNETITLECLGTLAIFNRKTVGYYRDRDEELLIKRILRIYDDTQDFSVEMFPKEFDKFMKAMKGE